VVITADTAIIMLAAAVTTQAIMRTLTHKMETICEEDEADELARKSKCCVYKFDLKSVLTLFIMKRRTPTSIYLPHFNKPKITLNITGTLYIECFFFSSYFNIFI
jgi:hypothetical protein